MIIFTPVNVQATDKKHLLVLHTKLHLSDISAQMQSQLQFWTQYLKNADNGKYGHLQNNWVQSDACLRKRSRLEGKKTYWILEPVRRYIRHSDFASCAII